MLDWVMAIEDIRACSDTKSGVKKASFLHFGFLFEMEKNKNKNFKSQFRIRTLKHLRKHCHKNVELKLFFSKPKKVSAFFLFAALL
jgi:hypothetical protein